MLEKAIKSMLGRIAMLAAAGTIAASPFFPTRSYAELYADNGGDASLYVAQRGPPPGMSHGAPPPGMSHGGPPPSYHHSKSYRPPDPIQSGQVPPSVYNPGLPPHLMPGNPLYNQNQNRNSSPNQQKTNIENDPRYNDGSRPLQEGDIVDVVVSPSGTFFNYKPVDMPKPKAPRYNDGSRPLQEGDIVDVVVPTSETIFFYKPVDMSKPKDGTQTQEIEFHYKPVRNENDPDEAVRFMLKHSSPPTPDRRSTQTEVYAKVRNPSLKKKDPQSLYTLSETPSIKVGIGKDGNLDFHTRVSELEDVIDTALSIHKDKAETIENDRKNKIYSTGFIDDLKRHERFYGTSSDISAIEKILMSSFDEPMLSGRHGLKNPPEGRRDAINNIERIAAYLEKDISGLKMPILSKDGAYGDAFNKALLYSALGRAHGLDVYPVIAGDMVFAGYSVHENDKLYWDIVNSRIEDEKSLRIRMSNSMNSSRSELLELKGEVKIAFIDYMASRYLNDEKRFVEAQGLLDAGSGAMKNHHGFHLERARSFYGLNRHVEGLEAARRARALNPTDLRCFDMMSRIYAELSKRD